MKFMDYLIKPVQRICKYPLLLDQLLDKRRKHGPRGESTTGTELDEAVVRTAGAAMRAVVSQVNKASEYKCY